MTGSEYITLNVHPRRVVVRFAGEVVADSRAVVVLTEGSIPPRLYFPRADVVMRHLEPTDHTTHCPHKGDAKYFSIQVGDQKADNAVWTYEQPIAAVEGITGLVSFYPQKVQVEERD